MKLILKNIGLIKSAELTLHPLSVIAGENDNGKSTVGKVLFCILKAVNIHKDDQQDFQNAQLRDKLHEIRFVLRRSVRFQDDDSEKLLEPFRYFNTGNSVSREHAIRIAHKIQMMCREKLIPDEATRQIEVLLGELSAILLEPEDTRAATEDIFRRVFAAEFDSSILLHGATRGSIELIKNERLVLQLEIGEENTVRLVDDVEPIELTDATFIESPLILNHHDAFIRTQTMFEMNRSKTARLGQAYTTLHAKDLLDKLLVPAIPQDLFSPNSVIQKTIQVLIGGEVGYSKGERDFVFTRDDERISIKNTASGIKTFGLLQILLGNELLSKNTMLIFDEPENHLHPKWQLILAEVLVELTKKGIFVLVSSHSPYMLEALQRYAEIAGQEKETRFFLAKGRIIEDQDQLPEIFDVLAEPFETFRQMDREAMKDA